MLRISTSVGTTGTWRPASWATVTLPVVATGNSTATGSGNVVTQFITDAGATVTDPDEADSGLLLAYHAQEVIGVLVVPAMFVFVEKYVSKRKPAETTQ